MFEEVEFLESVPSTNDYLKERAGGGRAVAVAARSQTSGRGRFGRTWHSPPDAGLYASFLFHPRWDAAQLPLLGALASLAVLRALRSAAEGKVPFTLKRPNDVLIRGRKVCGVLCESSTLENRVVWAVVGFGVNLFHEDFPEELAGRATSLRLEGLELQAPVLLRAIGSELAGLIERSQGPEWRSLIEEYEREAQ